MRMVLYIIITLLGLFFVLFGVLGILGSRLPETHVATQSIQINAPAAEVYGWIERFEEMSTWVPEITKVDRLADVDGKPVYLQKMGRNSFTTTTSIAEPPSRILRSITDNSASFYGSWDHVIEPVGEGACRLTLTETGTITSPIPRAILRYIIGEDFYLKKFLGHVQRKAAGM